MEKQVWEIMMSAHFKWERNHGAQLQDFISFYVNELYIEEVMEILDKEVETRLKDLYGNEYFCSEDEYILNGIDNNIKYWNDDSYYEPYEFQEIADEISDWIKDYREVREEIKDNREDIKDEVEDELRSFYYTFFNAPEELIVIYNGEVIPRCKR